MSCQNYRIIELQNDNIGAVAVDSFLPLGKVTRRISTTTGAGVPFQVASSGSDIVELTTKGYYRVSYNASLAAAGAGVMKVSLLVNGIEVYSVSETSGGTGTHNITLVKEVRVFSNCAACSTNCPADIQLKLSGVAITGGNSNLIVDSCVNG